MRGISCRFGFALFLALALGSCGDSSEDGPEQTPTCQSGFRYSDLAGRCVVPGPDHGCESQFDQPCEQPGGAEAYCDDTDSCAWRCGDLHLDCDADPSNGCETDKFSLDNCGECGRQCTGENAELFCAGSPDDGIGCYVSSCETGFVDADGVGENGCENTEEAPCENAVAESACSQELFADLNCAVDGVCLSCEDDVWQARPPGNFENGCPLVLHNSSTYDECPASYDALLFESGCLSGGNGLTCVYSRVGEESTVGYICTDEGSTGSSIYDWQDL